MVAGITSRKAHLIGVLILKVGECMLMSTQLKKSIGIIRVEFVESVVGKREGVDVSSATSHNKGDVIFNHREDRCRKSYEFFIESSPCEEELDE